MMSFCVVPWSGCGVDALLLGGDDVERQQPRRGRVDRHRRVHLAERDAVEQRVHVAVVGDRHADLADLAAGELVVGVVAGLRRQVEGDRQAGLALGEVARGRARWTPSPSSGRRRCASSTGGRARAGGGSMARLYGPPTVSRTPSRSTSTTSATRSSSAAFELDDVHRRPRPGVLRTTRCWRPSTAAAAADPADPHPLRPRGRHRARSCAAGPTSRCGSTSAARRT